MLVFGNSTWKSPVANSAALPTSGNHNGDVRVAQDTGHLWEWTGSAWQDVSGSGGGGGGGEYDIGNITGSVTIDYNNGSFQTATLTGNAVITITNLPVGLPLTLVLDQNITGLHTYTFTNNVLWGDPGTPSASSGLHTDVIQLIKRTSNYYLGSYVTGYYVASAFSNTKSVNFTGSGMSVDLSTTDTDIEYNKAWSWSFWFKATSFAGTPTIIGKQHLGGVYNGWLFWVTGGNQLVVTIANNYSTNAIEIRQTAANLTTGTWYHVAVCFDGTGTVAGTKVYLNGSLEPMTTVRDTLTATVQTTAKLQFGTDSGGDQFAGKMNQVSKWSKQLSGSDVTALYNSGTPTDLVVHPAIANLIGWWHMFDALNDSITASNGIQDYVGSNPGTGVGMTTSNLSTDVP